MYPIQKSSDSPESCLAMYTISAVSHPVYTRKVQLDIKKREEEEHIICM